MELTKLLRMNLQTFASGEEETPEETPEQVNDDNPKDTTVEEPENKPEEKTFTQSELDKIIADRLARAEKKREEAVKKERDEAERKRLEENEEYKELAGKLQKELDEQKADALKAKKETLLSKAGYNDEQVNRYIKYLEGETAEELQASLNELKTDIPPTKQYADPSVGNGTKEKPEKKGADEIGKSMFQRLKEKGKIR